MRNNLILLLCSTLITLLVAEGTLRYLGWVPGQIERNDWIEIVDSLYLKPGYVTDEHGLFRVDLDAVRKTQDIIESFPNSIHDRRDSFDSIHIVSDVTMVIEHHHDWDSLSHFSSAFRNRITEIAASEEHSSFDSALFHFKHNPINSDGFYSIPFSANLPVKTKILLLGDSFTWGHSASHLSGSFATTLLSRGYAIYNSGISGADVAQYRRIAETYLDRISPDVVVVNFFMGNDVAYYERIPEPGIPIHYATNAGNLVAFQDGLQRKTMQDAYKGVLMNIVIPKNSWFNKASSKTVIGTLIWLRLEGLGLVRRESPLKPPTPEEPFCNIELRHIKKLCSERNIKFILSVIPCTKNDSLLYAHSVPNLFNDLDFSEPVMTLDMYNQHDGHFNDQGHLFYANYLQHIIDSTLQK